MFSGSEKYVKDVPIAIRTGNLDHAELLLKHIYFGEYATMPRDEFAVHMLNDVGKEKAGALAILFSDCLGAVESIVGSQGREMAIVRTKMEEASFFAKKGMAVQPGNQQQAST